MQLADLHIEEISKRNRAQSVPCHKALGSEQHSMERKGKHFILSDLCTSITLFVKPD